MIKEVNMNNTIEILKNARKQKGITLKELSQKSGVSLGTVNKLFSGGIASVKVSTAQKLAAVLGVSLVGNDSEPKIKGAVNRFGFVKCAALTNEIRVADIAFNTRTTIELMNAAYKKGVSLAVFPELNVSSYTAGDLLMHDCIVG
jgi:transcriptional regulator with XRE-family HTH domain